MDLPLDALKFLSGILRECKPFQYFCMMICLYVGSGICSWIVNETVLHFNMFLLMHLCSLMIWFWPWRFVVCIWKLDNEKPMMKYIYIMHIYIYICILLLESIEKRIVLLLQKGLSLILGCHFFCMRDLFSLEGFQTSPPSQIPHSDAHLPSPTNHVHVPLEFAIPLHIWVACFKMFLCFGVFLGGGCYQLVS